MAAKLLNDRVVQNAKPKSRPYRLADGDSLYLIVLPTGSKSWQLRYRHNGGQQTLTLGKLELVGLAEARKRAQAARAKAADGEHLTREKHVAKARKAAAASNRFDSLARAWLKREARRKGWTWAIPRVRMKKKDSERGPHLVPLPAKLAAQLHQWQVDDNSTGEFVCPAPRNPAKSVTPEACEKHYRDALGLGGKHSPHSWRSAFKTVCSEAGKEKDVVESQLDHQAGTKVESAYDRAKRLDLRRELMTWYEATLIAARDGARVVPLQRHA